MTFHLNKLRWRDHGLASASCGLPWRVPLGLKWGPMLVQPPLRSPHSCTAMPWSLFGGRPSRVPSIMQLESSTWANLNGVDVFFSTFVYLMALPDHSSDTSFCEAHRTTDGSNRSQAWTLWTDWTDANHYSSLSSRFEDFLNLKINAFG